MNTKQLKSEIRRLKKVKKDLRKTSDEHADVKKRIKMLKSQLIDTSVVTVNKQKLMDAIEKLTPSYLKGAVDLKIYTETQLDIHLKNLRNKNENSVYSR